MAQELESTPEGVDPAVLDAIEANALAQLDAIRTGRQALEAHEWKVLAALGHLAIERADRRSGDAIAMQMRAIAAEIGLRSRVSDRTVESRIGEAMSLVDAWPALVAAFGEGRIGRGHVRVIAEAGAPLLSSDVASEHRATYEADMLALAETTTPARVATAARRAADEHLTEPLTARHRAAREQRRVRVTEVDDGMAWLSTLVPTVLAKGAEHRLRSGARAKAKDDPRTVDQWMADAACELLLVGTTEPTSDGSTLLRTITPVVQVTIPVTTITGVDDGHGVLDGRSPVDADTARILAGSASSWQRLLTDPVAGTVVEVDAYQPTAAQRRLLVARDQHCRFPGCAGVARLDDADHTIAWDDGGTTSLGNLAHLCRRHHTLKHATAWSVSHPEPGTLHWRSPLGHEHVDRPPPTGPSFVEEATARAVLPRGAPSDSWGAPDPDAPPHDAPF